MRPGLEISLLAISGRLIQAHWWWKCGQRTLFCQSAYMPEDIVFVADWLLRFPRSVDNTVMHCRMFRSAHLYKKVT